jgi:hypothetical protein
MGRLLADASEKMQRKTQLNSKDPTKLLVHTTHDSTLAALLCTFDVFDDKCVGPTISYLYTNNPHLRAQGGRHSLHQ